MKAIKVMGIICCMILAGSQLRVSAQESINRVMEKAEKLHNVNIDVVEQRNPDTKQMTRRVYTITFKDNNEELVSEFLAAFEKEKENTTKAIYGGENGRVVPTHFTFPLPQGGTVVYAVSFSENFSLTRIERF